MTGGTQGTHWSFATQQRLLNAGFLVLAVLGKTGMDHVADPTGQTRLFGALFTGAGLMACFAIGLFEVVAWSWRRRTGQEFPELDARAVPAPPSVE